MFGRLGLHAESDEMPHMDTLRVLASAGIVGLHLSQHTSIWPEWGERLGALAYLVDTFFVLSGYLMARMYGDLTFGAGYARFIQKRIARLIPLHWATALIFGAVGVVVALGAAKPDDASAFDLRQLPANLLLVHAWISPGKTFNGPSWSISAELLMYLLLPALLALKRGIWLALPIAFALVFITGSFNEQVAWRALPTFGLSIALSQLHGRRLPYAKSLLTASIIAYFASVFLGAPRIFSLGLSILMPILCIPADASERRSFATWASPLGTLTYSIYLIHPLVILIGIAFIGERILHLEGSAMNIMAILMVAPILIGSILSYHLLEMPARRAISALPLISKRSPPSSTHL